MKKGSIYVEPESYFNKDMLKAAEEYEAEKKAADQQTDTDKDENKE